MSCSIFIERLLPGLGLKRKAFLKFPKIKTLQKLPAIQYAYAEQLEKMKHYSHLVAKAAKYYLVVWLLADQLANY